MHNFTCKLEIVLNVNSLLRTCCVARHCAEVPYLEEEEFEVISNNDNCNMHAFFSFDRFIVNMPECKQPLRTMK